MQIERETSAMMKTACMSVRHQNWAAVQLCRSGPPFLSATPDKSAHSVRKSRHKTPASYNDWPLPISVHDSTRVSSHRTETRRRSPRNTIPRAHNHSSLSRPCLRHTRHQGREKSTNANQARGGSRSVSDRSRHHTPHQATTSPNQYDTLR